MAAAKPNSPNRILESWRMMVHGGVWVLYPVDAPRSELYRHEILQYVEMLKGPASWRTPRGGSSTGATPPRAEVDA